MATPARVVLFPCNGPQRILLPLPEKTTPLLGQVPSWRVIFTREEIPVLSDDNQAGADAEGYFPIVAAYLQANGCRASLCEDATIFVDDCMSRCSIWMNEVDVLPPTGSQAQTQHLDFKVKAASDDINTTLFHGSVTVTIDNTDPFNRSRVRGMMVQVSGVLCTQFELWARVPAGVGAMPLSARFQFDMDRIGSQLAAYKGTIAGGGDLPTF